MQEEDPLALAQEHPLPTQEADPLALAQEHPLPSQEADPLAFLDGDALILPAEDLRALEEQDVHEVFVEAANSSAAVVDILTPRRIIREGAANLERSIAEGNLLDSDKHSDNMILGVRKNL